MTIVPQPMYLGKSIYTVEQPNYCLEMNSGYLRFEFQKQPNWWWRFWQLVLLGWKWREM